MNGHRRGILDDRGGRSSRSQTEGAPPRARSIRDGGKSWVMVAVFALTPAACGSPKPEISPQADSNTRERKLSRAVVGAPPPLDLTCHGPSLSLRDLGDDLDDLWAGHEAPDTGKRVSLQPRLTLGFDGPIDPVRLAAAMTLTGEASTGGSGKPGDCTGASAGGPFTPHVVKVALSVTSAWSTASAGLPGQLYPRNFSALVFGNLSGLPHTEGPIAAGGNVNVQSFSLNQTAHAAVGVVAGGDLTAVSGSIAGAMVYGGALSLPASVNASGMRTPGRPVDFVAARSALSALSRALANYPANGTTSIQPWGAIAFAGNDPVENVFSVEAAALKVATSISISVPTNARAIVNVVGTDVRVGNCGISLAGADRGHLLWNLRDAQTVMLSAISLPGTLLAPVANVQLDNGGLEGTLVAQSLIGTGLLRYFPFVGFDAPMQQNRVVVDVPNPLFAGCRYTLTIAQSALTPQGACLAAPISVAFRVAARAQVPVERETTDRRWDPSTGHLLSFTVKDGVNTSGAGVLARYASALGLDATDTLVPQGAKMKGATAPDELVGFYRQMHAGVPVFGFGVTLHERAGAARWATARIVSGLGVSTSATVTQAQALSTAINATTSGARPWDSPGSGLHPPVAALGLDAAGVPRPAASAFKLIWRVDFAGTGVSSASAVDIDATGGAVRALYPTARSSCPGFNVADPATTGLATTLTVPTTRYGNQSIGGTLAKDSLGHVAYLLRTVIPTPVATQGGSPTALQIVCNVDSSFDEVDVLLPATAQFLVQRALAFYTAQKFPFVGAVGGATWQSFDGAGVAPLAAIVSTDPAFWQPNEPQEAKYVASTDVLKRGQIFFNPNSTLLSNAIVQPFVVGHELTHGVIATSRVLAGKSTWVAISEAGALDEGLSDAMGSMIARDVMGPSTSFWCQDVNCFRNLQDPKASTGASLPDTYNDVLHFYRVPPATCDDTNDYCFMHTNATIPGHWFYLLGKGGKGTNGNSCSYDLSPLDAVEDKAWDIARRVVFASFQEATDAPDFFSFHETTVAMAKRLYSDDVAIRVQAAWDAVGVLDQLSGQSPADNATDVPPWSLALQFHSSQVVPHVVQVSQLSATGAVVKSLPDIACVAEATGAAGTGVVTCPPVDLAPGTKYQWRARVSTDAAFSTCQPAFTFTTSKETVAVVYPAQMEGDVFVTNWMGDFSLSFPEADAAHDEFPRKISLAVNVGEKGACDRNGETSPPFDGAHSYSVRARNLMHEADITKVYYLNAMAYDKLGNTGECKSFPFKLYPMDRPSPIEPGALDAMHTVALPHLAKSQKNVTFAWSNVTNVGDYILKVYRWRLDNSPGPVLIPVFDDRVGVNVGPPDGPHKGDPAVAYYTFTDDSPTGLVGQYTWTISAVAADGSETLSSSAPDPVAGDGGIVIGYYVDPPAPKLIYPVDGLLPTEGQWTHLDWQAVDGAVLYRWRFWRADQPTVVSSGLVDTTTAKGFTNGPAPAAGYCWQMQSLAKGILANFEGKVGNQFCFHPLPSAVAITDPPTDGASVDSTHPLVVKWHDPNPPVQYAVHVFESDPPRPDGLVFHEFGPSVHQASVGDGTTAQSYSVSPLTDGRSYQVHVCVVWSDGTTGNCDARTVTAHKPPPACNVPAPVVPSIPYCQGPFDPISINFKPVPAAIKYDVEYHLGSTYSKTYTAAEVSADFHVDSTGAPIDPPVWYGMDMFEPALNAGIVGSFRIRATSSTCTGPWSSMAVLDTTGSAACLSAGYCAAGICKYKAPL